MILEKSEEYFTDKKGGEGRNLVVFLFLFFLCVGEPEGGKFDDRPLFVSGSKLLFSVFAVLDILKKVSSSNKQYFFFVVVSTLLFSDVRVQDS